MDAPTFLIQVVRFWALGTTPHYLVTLGVLVIRLVQHPWRSTLGGKQALHWETLYGAFKSFCDKIRCVEITRNNKMDNVNPVETWGGMVYHIKY